ncbi:(S)-2-haloacid dehalogenase [Halioglobus japonicus]|nr:(S)-2-haloacid dehalogenase [Halioglobus japonicus]
MKQTLAFDVYGTLIDTHGVMQALREIIGDRAGAFSQAWRDKQLEYSFRRGLMGAYQDFGVCTAQALDYTCVALSVVLSDEQKACVLDSYSSLPAFADVKEGLDSLRAKGANLFAFSNGRSAAVEILLGNAGILDSFEGVVSCDDVQTFKPNPVVYAHFIAETDSEPENTWLISSNPFDVIGAVSSGWKAAWVRRSEAAIFDPWEFAPTTVVTNLGQLTEKLIP